MKSYLLERIQMKSAETTSEVAFLGETLEEALKQLLATLKQMASDCPPDALSKNADDDTDSDLTYSSNDLESSMEQKQLVFLQNERSYIRFEASKMLTELGKTHRWVLPNLVQWIEQHQDEACVGAGIDALWEIVEGKG